MGQSNRKWVVLAAFASVAMVSQMLWLNFAPILGYVQTRYAVTETVASLLIIVFPLLYVFLSIPAGMWIDRSGYHTPVAAGAVLQGLCSLARIYDDSFVILVIAQTGIAIAQPFIVNGISKLATEWFDESQGAIATGIGTMGMFFGMALALAGTPVLVETFSFRISMILFGLLSMACAIFFILADPKANQSETNNTTLGSTLRSLVPILKNRTLLLIFFLSFLGLGFFNGLTTWLELILAANGVNARDSGLAGATLIAGGVLGSVIVPALSDRFKRRKPFVIGCVLIALLATYPFTMQNSVVPLLAIGGFLGFFFLPAYALLLEMCAEVAGEAHAGSATGLLMLAGNAGGVVVIAGMDAVKGDITGYFPSILFMLGVLFVALIGAVIVRETYGSASHTRS
ncbi:MAG: MFS transporter [Spirochaetia bacterium]|nr:MFS transporter [Spirochaetia bacterium]